MFTGLVADRGKVLEARRTGDGVRLRGTRRWSVAEMDN